MNFVEGLGSIQEGGPPSIDQAKVALTELLRLSDVGLAVTGARVVGRGARASLDLYLSDGTEVTFETLRDFANPTKLAVEIASTTGATPALKVPQAVKAVALVRALAAHEETFTQDHISHDWGATYLQSAVSVPVDMNDQQARWDAFCALERSDAAARARHEGITVAQASLVLVHTDGTRLVRCGWFKAHVRAEDATVSAAELAHRMKRVGWLRRGSTGRIKATRPSHSGELAWSFYTVPPAVRQPYGPVAHTTKLPSYRRCIYKTRA